MSNSWIRPIPRPPSSAALPPAEAGILDLQGKAAPQWEANWPLYEHIPLPGGPRSRIPEKEVQRCLAFMVWFRREHRGKLLFVHCTHGLNRTGYVVCRYLMQHEGMDAATAIETFARMHPPGIQRGHLKRHLKRVYFSTLSNRPRRGCAGRGRSSNSNRWSRCSVRACSNSGIAALKSP